MARKVSIQWRKEENKKKKKKVKYSKCRYCGTTGSHRQSRCWYRYLPKTALEQARQQVYKQFNEGVYSITADNRNKSKTEERSTVQLPSEIWDKIVCMLPWDSWREVRMLNKNFQHIILQRSTLVRAQLEAKEGMNITSVLKGEKIWREVKTQISRNVIAIKMLDTWQVSRTPLGKRSPYMHFIRNAAPRYEEYRRGGKGGKREYIQHKDQLYVQLRTEQKKILKMQCKILNIVDLIYCKMGVADDNQQKRARRPRRTDWPDDDEDWGMDNMEGFQIRMA